MADGLWKLGCAIGLDRDSRALKIIGSSRLKIKGMEIPKIGCKMQANDISLKGHFASEGIDGHVARTQCS